MKTQRLTLSNAAVLELYEALVGLEPDDKPPLSLSRDVRAAIARNIYTLDAHVRELGKLKRDFVRQATGGALKIEKEQEREMSAFLAEWGPTLERTREIDLAMCLLTDISGSPVPVTILARMFPMFIQ